MYRQKRYRIVLLLLLLVLVTGCTFGTVKKKEKDMSKIHHIKIEVENYGTIEAELDGINAPITVEHFVDNVKKGVYNGSTFHRIIKNVLIQGGAPVVNADSIQPIKGEFANNGVRNTISHVRGTLSMARKEGNDTATAQFFIVQQDSTYFDGNYAGFGSVTSGMEVVDKLAEIPAEDNNGTVAIENRPVIKSITLID